MKRICRFFIGLLAITLVYAMVFTAIMRWEGQEQNVDLLIGFYWVLITMTTVGYGEIIFRSDVGRIFSVLVALSGIFILFANALPIIVTPWFDRVSRELPTKAPLDLKDHVIVCGFSPIVETLLDKMDRLKLPFIVIERHEDVARSIKSRYPVIFGDPSQRGVLSKARIHSCRLLIANDSDEFNADVILTVREISEIEVIALVEDLSKSRYLSYAGASRVISPKTLLGSFLAQIGAPLRENVLPRALHLFGNLRLVELPLFSGSVLIGETISHKIVREGGAYVAGIWQRGRFISLPGPDEIIKSNSVMLAVGTLDQLATLRTATTVQARDGQFVVLGYGDVGRRIVKVLGDWGIDATVVDKRELGAEGVRSIVGDGTSEATLIEAGIRDAVGILIMLNDDSDVIYSTLVSRNINPKAFIIARANYLRSAVKIYRAGADYVAAVPLVASHMLFKMVQKEGEEMSILYEGLELNRYRVREDSPLRGKTLKELDLHRRFGCTMVAIDRAGEPICCLDSQTRVDAGDTLAIIGTPTSMDSFGQAFRPPWRPWRRSG